MDFFDKYKDEINSLADRVRKEADDAGFLCLVADLSDDEDENLIGIIRGKVSVVLEALVHAMISDDSFKNLLLMAVEAYNNLEAEEKDQTSPGITITV